jgi:hypothetical protein
MMTERIVQLVNLCEFHGEAAHELLDRFEIELGLRCSRGSRYSANDDREAEKRRREEELERKEQQRVADMQRMRRMLVRVAMKKWMNKTTTKAFQGWIFKTTNTKRQWCALLSSSSTWLLVLCWLICQVHDETIPWRAVHWRRNA